LLKRERKRERGGERERKRKGERERINAQQKIEKILKNIEIRALKWFGHLMGIEQKRLPRKLFKWTPLGKRKRRRLWRSWNERVRQVMENHELTNEDAMDRHRQRSGTGTRHLAV
jgi:hypothetical protein